MIVALSFINTIVSEYLILVKSIIIRECYTPVTKLAVLHLDKFQAARGIASKGLQSRDMLNREAVRAHKARATVPASNPLGAL
jgi:hypothetical protein